MPRSCLTFISLLALLAATGGLVQAANDIAFEPLSSKDWLPAILSTDLSLQPPPLLDGPSRLPSTDLSPPVTPSQEPGPAGETPLPGEPMPIGKPINLEGSAEAKPLASLSGFMGYRYSTDAIEWIPGSGDQFGMFSVLLDRYQQSGVRNGIMTGFGFHVFSGPVQSDMPPRAYDFSIGYQFRRQIGQLAFDLAWAVQVSSDFNGDARKGIQYPGHGVGFFAARPDLDLVFGVDYIDRADIKLLPVAGVVWKPNPEMRFELVFPRPRVFFKLTDTYRLYFSGELGGGTWAIKRPALDDNLATYSDLRACLGLASVDKDGRQAAVEIGYLFNRRLEYTSDVGNMRLGDGVLLRLLTTY
jgi:hypothetical protein